MQNIENTGCFYYIKRLVDNLYDKIDNLFNIKCLEHGLIFNKKNNFDYTKIIKKYFNNTDNDYLIDMINIRKILINKYYRLDNIKEIFINKIKNCKINNETINYKNIFINIINDIIENVKKYSNTYWLNNKIFYNFVNYRKKITQSSEIKSFIIIYGIYDNLCSKLINIYYYKYSHDPLCLDFIKTFNLNFYFNIIQTLICLKFNEKIHSYYIKYLDNLNDNILTNYKFKEYCSSPLFNNDCIILIFILKFIFKYYISSKFL